MSVIVIQSVKVVAAATLAASAVSVLPAVSSPSVAATAERPSLSMAATASDDDEEHLRPLLELITADRRGRFYTLNAEGAEKAEREHGFIPTNESEGISMFNREVPGTIAVHRLRLCEGHQAYLLVSNPGEIERLTDPDNPKWCFEDEGVLGYVYKKPKEGETMKLVRYTKNGDWRVARENRKDLIEAGFHVDGPLGHVPQG